MIEIWLTPEAVADVEDAASWYRRREHGLGEVFAAALDAKLAEMTAHPRGFPIVHGEIRRALLARFPYCVFYLVEGERLVVIACMHAARDPRTWQREVDGT